MEEDKQKSLRVSRLRQSYAFATHSLLKACSKEDFLKIVSSFKQSYQETLYQLYLKIIASMHENIQDEFESICQETQVMAALGTIEQLIENKKFDVLCEDNTSVNDVRQEIARRKLSEIHYLRNMLEKVQDQNEKDEKKLEVLQKSVERIQWSSSTSISELKSLSVVHSNNALHVEGDFTFPPCFLL